MERKGKNNNTSKSNENEKIKLENEAKEYDIFWKNEEQANRMAAIAIILLCILLAAMWMLNRIGVFGVSEDVDLTKGVLMVEIQLLIAYGLFKIFRGNKIWIRYELMFFYMVALAYLDMILSFSVPIIMAMPVVISCRYYSEKFTVGVSIITSILFGFSAYVGASLGYNMTDLNMVPTNHTTLVVKDTLLQAVDEAGFNRDSYVFYCMVQGFLPKLLFFILIAIACYFIVRRGKEMTIESVITAQKNSRVESELMLATEIQNNMLPNIFPVYPEHKEFDIYATMEPAKEVGGDFYDIFMTDDKHIAVVIADVSGKGVPAALYMVIAKTLIKNHAQLGLTPEEVFDRVNNILCENNKIGIFVTAWLGIMDINTGEVKYSNAGHNPPTAKLGKKGFEYLKMKPGLVLAGMEDYQFDSSKIKMKPGDKLFLYTDGITEANNAQMDLYGEKRLLDYLNEHNEDTPRGLLHGLKSDVDEFAGQMEQFDDITMLVLTYKGPVKKNAKRKKK